jgi:hypothetical protein
MTIFQGSALDIYIHWLILILGIGILLSGIAVMTSCRSFAGLFHLLDIKGVHGTGFYRVYFRYHSYYWVAFWFLLVLHLMVTITHLGLPFSAEPYFRAHQVVFFTSIVNLLLILIVFSSCKTFVAVINFFTPASPFSNGFFKRFYSYHFLFWWLLGLSVTGHIIFGLIHAVNT